MSVAKRAKTTTTMKSFIDVADDSHFPIQNLPYGVFRRKSTSSSPVCGVALGDYVVDLSVLSKHGLFTSFDSTCFGESSLNKFMGLGKGAWDAARETLQKVLSADDATIRDNAALRAEAIIPMSDVELMMPAKIGDYTDFYASKQHATNVGCMFRDPAKALLPNWTHLPVGYHGRASSVVLSGTPLRRPCGQLQIDPKDATKGSKYGACRWMDFELEMGVFIGPGNKLGEPIDIEKADDQVFGFVILNDWSARDIQKFEYVPLGPFGAKNFGSTISPWIVTPAALEPFRCGLPVQDPEPLPYLREPGYSSYDINLTVSVQAEDLGPEAFQLATSNYKYMYWTHRQQLVHHTVTGCNLNPGDLLGSGTISGNEPGEYGSLLELCWKATKPIKINNKDYTFLRDNDTVIMSGWCQGDGFRVGFGECTGQVLPAKPYQG